MANPPGSFDFYICAVEDGPAIVLLDMDAIDDAPVAALPLRVCVRIPMKSPYPSGLRSKEEAGDLFALEDRIFEATIEPYHLRYVGRVVTGGFTDLIFYAPEDLPLDALDASLERVRGSYEAIVMSEPDPEWSLYRDFMYPSPRDRQRMENARLLRVMEESGDDLEKARPVDHRVFFPSEALARTGADGLSARGFSIGSVGRAPDSQRWSVEFNRVETPADERMDEVVEEILDVVEPLEGDYDGWGSVVVPREPERR